MADKSDLSSPHLIDRETLLAYELPLRRNLTMAELLDQCEPLRLETYRVKVHLAHWLHHRANFHVLPHRHPFLEVTWLLGSRARFEVHQQTADVGPGEGFIAAARTPHAWSAEDPTRMFGLMLSLEPLIKRRGGKNNERHGEGAPPQTDRLAQAVTAMGHRLPVNEQVLELIQLLSVELEACPPHWRVTASGYFQAFTALVVRVLEEAMDSYSPRRRGRGPAEASPNSASRYVAAARGYIRAYYSTPIQVEDVAGHVGLTPRHLNRLLHKHGLPSIKTMLMEVRIKQAKELLHDRRHQIKAVALSCGFTDPAYFARVFSQATNLTPSQFRQQLP